MINLWSEFVFRWRLQLIKLSEHKHVCNLTSFMDTEVKFDVAAAEIYLHMLCSKLWITRKWAILIPLLNFDFIVFYCVSSVLCYTLLAYLHPKIC